MHLTLVGLSHKTAPIEIREKLTFPANAQAEALAALVDVDEVAEAVILSTCNRTEIYAVTASEHGGVDAVVDFLCSFHDLDRHELVRYLYVIEGEAVVRHLFRVVSSLDSMVVGEAQILHQVQGSLRRRLRGGHVRPRRSTSCSGRRSRSGSACGPRPPSARARCRSATRPSSWPRRSSTRSTGRTILVVGAGKMSELTAKHLVAQGVRSVLVANRTFERAEELAERFEGTAIPYEELFERMREADIVISSTAAPGYVIEQRRGRRRDAGHAAGRSSSSTSPYRATSTRP